MMKFHFTILYHKGCTSNYHLITTAWHNSNALTPTSRSSWELQSPNAMVTPMHIQPEWYFLFAYSILRSIPNKLGGIAMMIMSSAILNILPLNSSKLQTIAFYPLNQNIYWIFLTSTILFTWTGVRLAESPFISVSQIMTLIYFSYFIMSPLTLKIWDKLTDL